MKRSFEEDVGEGAAQPVRGTRQRRNDQGGWGILSFIKHVPILNKLVAAAEDDDIETEDLSVDLVETPSPKRTIQPKSPLRRASAVTPSQGSDNKRSFTFPRATGDDEEKTSASPAKPRFESIEQTSANAFVFTRKSHNTTPNKQQKVVPSSVHDQTIDVSDFYTPGSFAPRHVPTKEQVQPPVAESTVVLPIQLFGDSSSSNPSRLSRGGLIKKFTLSREERRQKRPVPSRLLANHSANARENSKLITERILATLNAMDTDPLAQETQKPAPSMSMSWGKYHLDLVEHANASTTDQVAPEGVSRPPVTSLSSTLSKPAASLVTPSAPAEPSRPSPVKRSAGEVFLFGFSTPPPASGSVASDAETLLNKPVKYSFSKPTKVIPSKNATSAKPYQFVSAPVHAPTIIRNASPPSHAAAAAAPLPSTGSSSSSVNPLDKFKARKPGSWTCSACLVNNLDAKLTQCPSCETPKEAATSTPPSSSNPLAKFMQHAAGSWACPSCKVRNGPSQSKCPCCETAKPADDQPAPTPSTASVGGFACFGVSDKPNDAGLDRSKEGKPAPPSSGLFSFGVKESAAPAANVSFGVPAEPKASVTPAAVTTSGGFSFGAPAETNTKPATGFGFTLESKADKTGADDKQNKPAFTFGAATSASDKATSDDKTAKTASFGFGKPVDTSEDNPATGGFGATSTTTSTTAPTTGGGGFSFGTPAAPSTGTKEPVFSFGDAAKPATSSASTEPAPLTSFSFAPPVSKKRSADSEQDGAGPTKVGGSGAGFGSSTSSFGSLASTFGSVPADKPSTFGSVPATSTFGAAPATSTTATPTFGASSGTLASAAAPTTAAPAASTFGASSGTLASAAAPTTAAPAASTFGASSGTLASAAAPTTAAPAASSTFVFGSTAPPPSSTPPKATPAFGGSFGAPAAAPSTSFSFGSNTTAAPSGGAFGAPAAAAPAAPAAPTSAFGATSFGAAAPSASFGQSPPTSSSAFGGGSTFNFGSAPATTGAFGAPAAAPAFGGSAPTSSSSFGGSFGAPAAPTSSGFGAPPAASGGFGAPTPSFGAPPSFGGAPPAPASAGFGGFGGFGQPAPITAAAGSFSMGVAEPKKSAAGRRIVKAKTAGRVHNDDCASRVRDSSGRPSTMKIPQQHISPFNNDKDTDTGDPRSSPTTVSPVVFFAVLGNRSLVLRVTEAMSGIPFILSSYFITQKLDRPTLSFKDNSLLGFAASNGHLSVVQAAVAHFRHQGRCMEYAIFCATVSGQLHILEWLFSNYTIPPPPTISMYALNGAAKHGHLNALQFLHAQGCTGWSADCMDSAAAHGHLSIVKFLHTHRTEGCTTFAMNQAAENGHLDVVRFLHEHRTEGCTSFAMNQAAKNGHLSIVKYLHTHRTEGCTTYAMTSAAFSGHLSIVQFLHFHRQEGCTKEAMDGAALYGHLDIVKFLHEHRSEGCTEHAINWAASRGSLDIVRYLHANRVEGSVSRACALAARFGHATIVNWRMLTMERLRRPKTAAATLPRTSKHDVATSRSKKSAVRMHAGKSLSSPVMCPPLHPDSALRPVVAVTKTTIHLTANINVKVQPDSPIMESNHQRVNALAKKSAHPHLHADIDFDGLRPLVDIAYWSTFSEVRRDAAAAFATLSKNGNYTKSPSIHLLILSFVRPAANLDILAQAGGLGAALALLHGAKSHMDLCVQLPSIQLKLLHAPNGIASIFALLRVADVHVKRTALRILLQMLHLPDAAPFLVTYGGFRLLLHLLRTVAIRKDTKLKQLAALVLKRLAVPERNKDAVADEPDIAKILCQLFQDPYLDTDMAFRRDLLETMLLLAQDRRAARHFVEFNVVPSLLLMLASPPSQVATSYLVISLLEVFASNPRNLPSLLHDDILPPLLSCAFHPPPSNMHVDVRIKALMVLNHIVLLPSDTRQVLLDLGIVELISCENVHLAPDKRVRKLGVSLLTSLPVIIDMTLPRDTNADAVVDKAFHLDMIARGLLPCLMDVLREDAASRGDVVTAMWHLCESDCPRLLLCKEPVLEAFLALSIHHDVGLKTKIAKIFADFATKAENTHKLVESRIVLFLVKSIAPSCRHAALRYEATRAFVGLAATGDEQVRDRLVQYGVVGFLIRITKRQDPKCPVVTATCAQATLAVQHLRHDAAALQIQGIMRNWLVRKATQAIRLDAYTSRLSPRKKRLQHVAIRAGKVKTSLASDLFDSFAYHVDETLGFRISLPHLLEGLSVFGMSSLASTSVTWSFDEDSACFQMVLTDNGILAECAIQVLVEDDLHDFTQGDFERSFEGSAVVGRVIIQSNALQEVAQEFADLPPAAPVTVRMHPNDAFQLQASSSEGNSCEIDVAKTSPALIEYATDADIASTFQWSLLHDAFHGLGIAAETFIRLNAQGYCSIQHMVHLGSKRAFVDALLCPDVM
ncbi:hypothetical protein DYB38_003020 [Aphanomyces astaci]|uniref:RanBP2-type domain-containing protein n=3 Tax=Aphanomyces astaci TaxID=112090 RepID=A0A397DNV1_APHAT|nr:hypothetical protein DYB38_003020 [Aphanomyces astaci]